MNDELIKNLVQIAHRDDNYFTIVEALSKLLPRNLHEQLQQLLDGPVHDGDVICKENRNRLIKMGLAVRVCCKGEQGYTGAAYISYTLLGAINAIKKNPQSGVEV